MSQDLAENSYYVVAPFQRGYAATARPNGLDGYTFTQFVGDVLGIADDLHLNKFDVVGFGVGGSAGVDACCVSPDQDPLIDFYQVSSSNRIRACHAV